MPETSRRWMSVHLNVRGSVAPADDLYGLTSDSVLTGLVAPVTARLRAEGHVAAMFFVRYGWEGPHLRVRFLVRPGNRSSVLPAVEGACVGFDFPTAGGIYSLLPEETVYEPELDRYGGRVGVAIAERLFAASSSLTLELLPLVCAEQDAGLRLGLAVMSAVLLMRSLFGYENLGDIASFLSQHSLGRLLQVDEARRAEVAMRLEETAAHQDELYASLTSVLGARPTDLPDPLAGATTAFENVREALVAAWRVKPLRVYGVVTESPEDALRRLAGSYLHMHLNRMGIPPWSESVVCTIAARAVGEGAACAT
ncbi:MAG: thiopeptide-type bacteriocin biosynthesis protein [Gemmatimonadetes bacterium]|nr:thiopeptide-type bacteriocin biosynthesis protein [Gemmatimonadota bacterium]